MAQVEPHLDNPVPFRPGQTSPIKYCIYVIKENRTYDQVLGDMPEGNGDAGLCLFPEKTTPNHHKLAREFVLLDNFYVDAEVSADGHEWSMGAYASDFVEKTWPFNYGHPDRQKKFLIRRKAGFRLPRLTRADISGTARARRGCSYRSYGEFVFNGKTADDPGFTRIEALKGHFDPKFRSFDTDYSDLKRAGRFIEELKQFEVAGEMPRLQNCAAAERPHVRAHAGQADAVRRILRDNDAALGMVVEAVSRSKFWPETAIFVVEDDAQDGYDHVDAHRSIAPGGESITHRHSASGFDDESGRRSLLRTMELILWV